MRRVVGKGTVLGGLADGGPILGMGMGMLAAGKGVVTDEGSWEANVLGGLMNGAGGAVMWGVEVDVEAR